MSHAQELDWDQLGVNYVKTDYRYVSCYRDGAWDEGGLSTESKFLIDESAHCMHYGQACFEGMKAYRRKDGGLQLFRPEQNAQRFQESCRRLLMPVIPTERFVEACAQVVRANADFVPPYGSGAALYLRPFMVGVGEHLGSGSPAKEYRFTIFCCPVGRYYKDGIKPVNYITSLEYDRAAPWGTGRVKIAGNYAAALMAHQKAVEQGFADCIYLDPQTHTKIDEVGAANFFGITKDKKFVAPNSPTILPSITKYSLMYLAKEYLGMETEERDVSIDGLDEFAEAGACGTAAVIVPIGGIQHKGKLHVFYSQTEIGPVTKKLYELLWGIQCGDVEAPKGWIYHVS